ncbi:dehydrogenase [Prevotella pallens]|nr:dehydrogenase [Prevotella pallens]MBF1501736.1 dehydrogenase [Prevotella pallens]
MADNFLEKHYEEYEQRKAEWLRKRRHLQIKKVRNIRKPDDEAL